MSLVLSAAQMRAVDAAAIGVLGVPGLVLMENAGRGVADIVARALPALRAAHIAVVCGAGQNGGDGFVVARHLANRGAYVHVYLALPREKISGDALVWFQVLEKMPGVSIEDGAAETDVATWYEWLQPAVVVVDAIFGTGVRDDVRGTPAAAIAAMNGVRALRVSVDLPSGIDADTGAAHGAAVVPDITATMACRKLGLVLDPDAFVGRVEIVDIGVAAAEGLLLTAARAQGPLCHWLEAESIGQLLPRRLPSAHKGTAGRVMLVAGSPGKTGAALLAALGALRGGAGLVTVASTRAGQIALDAKVVEAMTAVYTDGDDADATSFERLASVFPWMQAAAVGPGIPTGPGMQALVSRLAAELAVALVLDADALNLLGRDAASALRRAPAPRVLTPHPGEMARLMGMSTADVQKDRLGLARRLAAETGAVVVLKGARTVIAAANGTAYVNPAANPSLGTAGSGDVLTGLITGLLGQGMAALDAACAGVFVHGQAAEDAAKVLGTRRLLAGDLPEAIARVMEKQLSA